jgi:uncharacterized repeat protein (TIGR01451 family)/uncharacterized repeat protein (TIGR02543 family)
MKRSSICLSLSLALPMLVILPTARYAQSPCNPRSANPDPAVTCRSLSPSEKSLEDNTRNQLQDFFGITINHDHACPTGVDYHDAEKIPCLCTSVRGLRPSTITALIAFKTTLDSYYQTNVPFQITGGTECGHLDSEAGFGHSDGYKVDIHPNSYITNFINMMYIQIENRGRDCAPQYISPSGYIFAFESDPSDPLKVHWDVKFGSDSYGTLILSATGDGHVVVSHVVEPTDFCDVSTCDFTINPSTGQYPPDCTKNFKAHGDVTLDAVANPGFVFVGWTGAKTTSDPFITITMGDNKAITRITAMFVTPPPAPPGQSNCWGWDSSAGSMGGWTWRCTGKPPLNPNLPPPSGCWHPDPSAGGGKGGFIFDHCGGDDMKDQRSLHGSVGVAGDPNDKVGAQGVGDAKYISGQEPLRYALYFENLSTATAPAQDIVITDQLDTAKVDLNTFSLGSIAFGDNIVTPSVGLTDFKTDVDLRPANNIIVRISASLDKNTGQLTWRFNSIDPATGQPPTDPLAGFLPPGAGGSVLFNVTSKKELPTNTVIRNKGTIVFDVNPSMDTPEWFNTLDNTKPNSHVLPLTATQSSASFQVNWTGSDVGSGIQDFTVFVSEDGGPFTTWLTNAPATQGTFTGQFGKSYAFYSIARDQTNNIEDAKTAAEATTHVENADLSITNSASPNPVVTGSNATYSLTVTNNGPSDASNVTVTDNLPGNMAFVSCNATGGGICGGSGNNRTVSFTSLASGASVTMTIVATLNCSVPDNTVINNTATASSSTNDADPDNNSATATITVSNPPPVITCPTSIVKSTDTGKCSALVTYATPAVTDHCPGTTICSPQSGSGFPKGTTTVTCTTTSTSGNQATCSFTVTLNDIERPSITRPPNKTVGTDPNQCSAVVTYATPTVTDNCPCNGADSAKMSVVQSSCAPVCNPPSGATFPKGTTTVNCSVSDASGNQNACSFTVMVDDPQPPGFPNGCPTPVNVAAAATCPIATSTVVSYVTPVATDNCPGVAVSCSPPSGSNFPVGTTTVTCTATDTSVNTAQCTLTVTVFSFCLQDETNPGSFVLVNALTGDYIFLCNGSPVASGQGTLTTRACIGSIDQTKGDRRVHLQWDTSVSNNSGAGTAIVQKLSNKVVCQITDKNMSNNVCSAQVQASAPKENTSKARAQN